MSEVQESDYVEASEQALFSGTVYLPDTTNVERSAFCKPEVPDPEAPEEVMVGFCGRVDNNSNFTHVAVYCRPVDPDTGELGPEVTRGDASCAEKIVRASSGWVAVGAAASVSSDNLAMAAVRQCPWLPSQQRVNVSTSSEICAWRRDDGVISYNQTIGAEKLTDSHAGQTILERQHRVLRGVGFTSSNDNLARLRIAYGKL